MFIWVFTVFHINRFDIFSSGKTVERAVKSWKKTKILSSEEKFYWIEWENGGFEEVLERKEFVGKKS
ncbi:hypothetical protein QWT87_11130 [Chryseobacterium sp. APV1]|uniref:Uncharacterized protein n=1 Tax=Chryseobacterium urinae TaxID=3058400 RepID=A0ABT8U311_9FLAO|nr:hypothetical protein [Chryseobacterium sp. APV1]MDO3425445.1 hypothetical protein [Chryseobacterium sp. APV1]